MLSSGCIFAVTCWIYDLPVCQASQPQSLFVNLRHDIYARFVDVALNKANKLHKRRNARFPRQKQTRKKREPFNSCSACSDLWIDIGLNAE